MPATRHPGHHSSELLCNGGFHQFSRQETPRWYVTDGTTETSIADATYAVIGVHPNYDEASDHTVSVFNANFFFANGFSRRRRH
jgi:hypothetical protein